MASQKRDHHKHRVSAFEAVTQFDDCHFTEFEPALTPDEQATLASSLEAARKGDVAPLAAFWVDRYERASGTALGIARAICQDKDAETDGTPVKPHVHFLAAPDDTRRALDLKEISHALGIVPTQVERIHQGEKFDHFIDNKTAYLIHALESQPGKHHYDPSEVVTLRGEDFRKVEARSREKWSFAAATKSFKSISDELNWYVREAADGNLTKREVLADRHLRQLYASSPNAHARLDLAFKVAAEARQQRTAEALDWGLLSKCSAWIWGSAGSGKTSLLAWVITHFFATFYGWQLFEASSRNPVDNYSGEEMLLLDDIRSKNADGDGVPFEDALRIFDPHKASKASARFWDPLVSANLLLATSPTELTNWTYFARGNGRDARRAGAMEQLMRRFAFEVEALPFSRYGIYNDRFRVGRQLPRPRRWDPPEETYRTINGEEVTRPAKPVLLSVDFVSPLAVDMTCVVGDEDVCTGFWAAAKVVEAAMAAHGMGPLTTSGIEAIGALYRYRLQQMVDDPRTPVWVQVPQSMLEVRNVAPEADALANCDHGPCALDQGGALPAPSRDEAMRGLALPAPGMGGGEPTPQLRAIMRGERPPLQE